MEEKKTVPPQSAAIPAVIIFFILLFVFTKWGPAINFSSTTQSKGEPFVVTGEGKVSVTPDIANVTLGIRESGPSLKTVQNAVNSKSKTLTDALKKLGVDEKDIKTSSYNVYPQYDYTASIQRIIGYQVSTNYRVTVRDFDKINDIVVAGTTAGANTVGNISFELNDSTQTEKMNVARQEAVKDAKSKAEGLAKAAGITLGRVINIAESQNQNTIRPVAFTEKSDIGIGGGTPVVQPNIQPGETEINMVVSLSYEVR